MTTSVTTNVNTNLDRVKIVVVGDSGVGKTSLVHMIIHQDVLKKPSWTIGSSVDVKLHEFKDGTPQHKTYFIEIYDIGGKSAHRPYQKIFYSDVDGVVLVHDLTNRKSQENLKYWLSDVIEQSESLAIPCSDLGATFLPGGGGGSGAGSQGSPLQTPGSAQQQSVLEAYDHMNMPPLFVVGTKLDQAQKVRAGGAAGSLRSSLDIPCRYEEVNLSCMEPKHLAPASTNSIKLAKFFDRVIEYKQGQKSRELAGKLTEKRNSNFVSIQVEQQQQQRFSSGDKTNLFSRAPNFTGAKRFS